MMTDINPPQKKKISQEESLSSQEPTAEDNPKLRPTKPPSKSSLVGVLVVIIIVILVGAISYFIFSGYSWQDIQDRVTGNSPTNTKTTLNANSNTSVSVGDDSLSPDLQKIDANLKASDLEVSNVDAGLNDKQNDLSE